jgi:sugar phosphate permease
MNKNKKSSNDLAETRIKRLGRLAWIIWAIAMAAQVLNTVNRVAATPAVDRIMADFGMTAVTWGSLMSMYFYIYAIMQFPSGIMADYLGPRKTITIGTALSTVGALIFGLAPSVPVLFIGRFLLSVGVGLIYVNILRITIDWFKRNHFARMVGFNGFISTTGSALGAAPVAILISAVDWRWSFIILASINLAVCIACWLIIKNKPSDVGLPSPDEAVDAGKGTKYTALESRHETTLGQNIRFVLTCRHTWATFVVGAGLFGTIIVFVGAWGIPYLMQVYGLNRGASADLMSIMLMSHAIGLFVVPIISDKLTRRKLPIIVCCMAYLVTILVFIFWNGGKPPLAAVYPLFVLMGLFSGATTLSYVVAKENMPASDTGIVLGMSNMSAFLSGGIFQLLVGVILDANWQGAMSGGARVYSLQAYQTGFWLLLIPAVAAAIGSLLLRETRCRDIG